ncbi:MAG TPA: hypothetical protein VG935_03990 [Patescibacteria group bacterium]|nr:hypothetical protein [Patescibacteria group bacterium]
MRLLPSKPDKKFLAHFLIASFILSFVLLIGFHLIPNPLISPLQLIPDDTLTSLLPHLRQHPNTFYLHQASNSARPLFIPPKDVEAKAYLVIDLTSGEIVGEHNADSPLAIASLTKIMSAVVTLDLASPEEQFKVTPRAAAQIPTKIGVVAGETMTVHELLEASLMTSANDAIEVLRDGIDAKYADPGLFVRAMNKKAEILGLTHTHFDNPQGFDSLTHYSSAHDLAILTHYALTTYPLISQIVKQDYIFLPKNSLHKQFDLYNWNGLLDVYPGVIGVKIGNTDDAETTTIVAAQRDDETLLVVVLGAPGIYERDEWAAELLDAGFSATRGLPPVNITSAQLKAKYATWKYWQ